MIIEAYCPLQGHSWLRMKSARGVTLTHTKHPDIPQIPKGQGIRMVAMEKVLCCLDEISQSSIKHPAEQLTTT